MSRGLILLNAVLVAGGLLSVGYVVRELRAAAPVTTSRPRPPATEPVAAPAPPAEAPTGGYAVVASRNLFSPTRTEAPVTQTTAGPAVPKPNLYGIILRDGAPVAYLEDPTTKRVAGYRLGDAVAGGTVKQIGTDHVVLNRPEGDVNVRLRDPSKPRPPAPPPVAQPGVPPGVAGQQPGVPPGTIVVPPGVRQPIPPVPGQAVAPQQQLPQSPQVLPRRPLPPNLLRRLPQSPSDAPAQQ
jgi:hypothetical protein